MINAIDYFFLNLDHNIACPFLTFICKLITLLGEKGILFLIAAVICMLFPKSRKFGVCLFGAIACSFLFSNIILKHLINRPRPYEWNYNYRLWWEAIKAPLEDGSSFPSGHVTAAAAGCTAICLTKGKKWLKASIIWVCLMMFARCYLMAHHPTDVIVGLVLGIDCGFAAYYITKLIYKYLENNEGKKWVSWWLYFEIPAANRAYDILSEKLPGVWESIASLFSGIKIPVKQKASKHEGRKENLHTLHAEEDTGNHSSVKEPSEKVSKIKFPSISRSEKHIEDNDSGKSNKISEKAPAHSSSKTVFRKPEIKAKSVNSASTKSAYVGKHVKKD